MVPATQTTPLNATLRQVFMITERLEKKVDYLTRLLERPALRVLLCVFLLLPLFLKNREADPDLFARLAAGAIVLDTGMVAQTDPFAFTPKKVRWIDHEWFAGVCFELLRRAFGDVGLWSGKIVFVFLTICLLAAAQDLVFQRAPAKFSFLLLTVLLCRYVWLSTVRAQVFTYLGLAWFLYVVVRAERAARPGMLWLLPPTMVLWCNAHGGFVLGLLLLACVSANQLIVGAPKAGTWIAVTIASIAATLINPYGIEYWRYIFEALSMSRPSIGEWDPVRMMSPLGLPLLGASAVIISPILRGAVRVNRGALAFMAIALVLAFRSERLAAPLYLALSVYGVSCWQFVMHRLSLRLAFAWHKLVRSMTTALCGFVVYAAGFTMHALGISDESLISYQDFPVAALDWLALKPPGKILVGFNQGSYVLWRLGPQFQISLDGRYEEVYPESTLRLVSEAYSPTAPEFRGALEQLNPDYILLGPVSATDATWAIKAAAPYRERYVLNYSDWRYAVLTAEGARP